MRKTIQFIAAPILALAVLALPALAEGPEIKWDLKDALKQVDRQSDNFETAMARIEFIRTDREGNETQREKGTFFINKRGEIAAKLNDMMVENGGMIPLVHRGRLSAHANSLGGVKLNVWDSELWNIADWYRIGN